MKDSILLIREKIRFTVTISLNNHWNNFTLKSMTIAKVYPAREGRLIKWSKPLIITFLWHWETHKLSTYLKWTKLA